MHPRHRGTRHHRSRGLANNDGIDIDSSDTVRITDCHIRDTRLGGIKLFSVDGAHLHDVRLSAITMKNVAVPIMIRLGARLKTFREGDTKKPAGVLRDVTIANVSATDSR